MRALPLAKPLALTLGLLLASVAHAAPSNAWLVRYHLGAWRPASLPMRALRFDPETGEAIAEKDDRASLAATANARALAEASVVRRADGSRHARALGAFQRFTVVTTDDQGALQQQCVHSAAEAEAIVRAAVATEKK